MTAQNQFRTPTRNGMFLMIDMREIPTTTIRIIVHPK